MRSPDLDAQQSGLPWSPTTRVATVVLVSLLGMVVPNVLEFGPAGLVAPEVGTIPIAIIQIGLLLLWWRTPALRPTAMAGLLALAALHLVAGAIISVLPLDVLPFVPERSLSHYLAHLAYGLAQLPLLAVGMTHGLDT